MDVSRDDQRDSWIPRTPLLKSQVIYTNRQGNQIDQDQVNRLGSKGFSLDFPHETRDRTLGACLDSVNGNREAALEAKKGITGDSAELCSEFHNSAIGWSFTSLLAQQDPASAASTSRATYGIGDFMLGSNTQWSANFEWRSQQNLPIPHGPVHDLYLPPEETVNSISSQITCQITPVTPEKAARTECRQVAQMQNLCTNGKAIQEISEVDTNRLQTDTELQKVARNSSFATVSTARTENGNPGQYGANDISLGETPQQKTRRKKHRPKVITEGKPRTRKPVTPKPAPCTESPTGKRKYVRKKPPDKAPRTPPAESNETPTGKRKYVRKKLLNQVSTPEIETAGDPTSPQAPKPANKSCRRSLNFDIEEQALNDNCNCKPNSNGDSQPQAEDVCGGSQSKKSTVTLGQGIEVMVETTQAGIRHDFTHSLYQMLQEYNSLPEKQPPKAPQPAKNCPPKRKWNDNCQENHEKWGDRMANHYVQQNTTQITLRTDTQFPPVPTNASNWNPCTTKIEEEQENKSKWYNSIHQPSICSANLAGIYYNAMPAYEIESLVKIPSVARKKRTVKGQNSTTSSTSSMTAAKDMVGQEMTGALGGTGRLQYKMQSPGFILTQMKRSTRKRSRGPTQSQDLDALTKIARGERHPIYTARQAPKSYNEQQVGDLNRPHACVEALAAESHKTLTTKKRTKKIVSLVNSVSSITNDELSYGKIILYNQNEYSPELIGPRPDIMQKEMSSIDVLAEQLQHLDINRDGNALVSHSIGNEQQNALVLYREDGTIVPFTGVFKPIKKRRPRPKVDLDEETNRVWKLLLGNINSEGIDGTNEEKAKWWKEEREVFRGRANSFIARMHLVQGDRRFSQWKGSVVDSVIGVFLTQNVSDHLSSSAFMSLTAQFPLKSPFCGKIKDSVIEKPIVCMPDLEDVVKWNEMSNHSICDQSSMTFHDYELDEEREVVYSNESPTSSTGIVSSRGVLETYCESTENRTTAEIIKTVDTCYMEEKRSTPNDASSSQNSAVSSQNSADSPVAQTDERKESFSENNSEEEDQTDRSKPKRLNSSSSFMELLIKAGSNKLHEVLSHRTVLSDQNSINECKKAESVENNSHIEKMYIVDSSKSSLEVFVAQSPSNDCHSHVTSELKGLKVEDFKMITEERGYSDISKNNGRNHKQEQSSFTAEYASHIIDENNQDNSSHEASRYPTANNQPFSNNQEGKHLAIQSQGAFAKGLNIVEKLQTLIENNELQQNLNLPNLLGKTQDFVERSSGLNNKEKNLQKTIESDLLEHGLSEIKEHNTMNDAKRKAKSRRVGKEIRDDIDWDALRRQAEANGRKRERTPNTMDSLDWEAVRCADVNEIANTIKERGMNNMLAERIKDFLNRLVREHGSIDLEWLRDVPPDKAKEYLLSIRGLGLKSVECVRLLTLHHLAFPVDTNVGRIAVRLGWVPLQPLPESLQLHLLELYPVLESIQQYLWPRLCKLDQRTLYELHYQMITFGKVFCTKNKPNCNACPMRGECRHFASAFASARLALPGPEEKGIVRTTENRRNEPMPAVMVDQLPLPPPQATEQSEKHQQLELERQPEARYGVRNCEPIVEEPSSPEPECTQVTEHDMEDTFSEDPDEIPTIKLNIEEFTQNLQNYMQENMELQVADMSKALVALTAEAASIPMPKLKNVSRLRTEHQVYELPDSHPLLQGLDRRELDDPCLYLLAIWTPGETANSIQPPESTCNSQEYGKLCDETTCFSCNSIREANSQIVRGTLLIPCRTAMRGSFPLNGTYFQVNEVFADHDSSLNPIDVPRAWIWNLPRRTVYFGTSIPTIFKGLTTEGIQHCFWRGYVCVRGFDQKTRAPRPLMARLHFPASKVNKTRGKGSNE